MIKNIIFDIGNVLAEFRWKDYIAELGITGDKAERLARITVESEHWVMADAGIISTEDILPICLEENEDIESEIRLFFKDRRRLVMEYAYAAGWIDELKARGFKIYILSDYSEDNFELIRDTFSFLGREDGRVVSYMEKCTKPSEKMYNTLLERYGLNASECVFLDDKKINIEGAEKAGIHGIVFKDYESARAELEKLIAAV